MTLQLALFWRKLLEDPHQTLAIIFAVSAGGAAIVALLIEGGGLAVLLIPARVRHLVKKGRAEANAEWEAWLLTRTGKPKPRARSSTNCHPASATAPATSLSPQTVHRISAPPTGPLVVEYLAHRTSETGQDIQTV